MATPTAKAKPETAPKSAKQKPVDDFFDTAEPGANIDQYVKHMKETKEVIDTPPILAPPEDLPADPETPEEISDDDREMLNYFDYTDHHYKTAEFILIWLDKGFAFGASMVSGMDMDRYRKRLKKPQGDDYEAEITAALVKKYQATLPLEWMLVSALLMAYVPEYAKAFKDRREQQAAKLQQQRQSRPIT